MIPASLKTLIRTFGMAAPRQARRLLRVFSWNSDYYLRAALLMNLVTDLGATARMGPLRGVKFEGMLYEELDPLLRDQMEPIISSLLLKLDLKGKIALDVGASYGFYAALLSRCVGVGGMVYAFEPDVQSLMRLAHNMEINDFHNVVLLPYALANEARANVWEIDLLQPWNNRIVRPDERVASPETIKRPIVSIPLDMLLDTLPAGQIALLKIDVEGGEVDVLRGAGNLFGQVRPLVVIELHSAALARETFDILKGFTYGWQTIEFKDETRHHVFAFPEESRDTYATLLKDFVEAT